MLRRQRARGSLIEFSQAIDLPGVPVGSQPADAENPLTGKLLDPIERDQWQFTPVESRVAIHHALTMAAIERCMLKPRGRLMIFEPPGSAKSTYAVAGSAWYLGKFPGSSIIYASYATSIAAKQSRRVRSICRDPAYQCIWPEKPILADYQRAIDDWSLTNASTFMAAGILAGITGNRADGFIIDDPVANREQADSPAVQQKTYDEYIDTAMTRAKPNMWAILIMTRWNESDLAGSILPEKYNGESGMIACRDGQTWEVLCIPAEAERNDDVLGRKPGEFLWPEWFPREHWTTWRDNPRAKRTWSALYQQRPAPLAGVQFSREVLEAGRYDADRAPGDEGARPVHLRMYGASDYATLKDDGDFSEHGVFGMDENGELWAVDWWYGQKETDVSIDAFIAKVGIYKPARWWNEGGLIDKAIGPAIRRRMRETQQYVVIDSLTSIQDKGMKLQAFHARVGAGAIHFPRNRPWADRVIDQLVGFPGARYDDAADVCGLIGRGIDKMTEAHVPTVQSRPMLIPYSAQWLEYNSGSGKPKVRYTS
ncbi:MAG: terminase large subunit domain-containing protein [Terriglobales bacterium]